jgi:folate-dependent phosphoribosylglycinamide formyltransferase PurN
MCRKIPRADQENEMKAAICMRLSAPQIYCANYLHKKGCLDAVVLESGSSFETETAGIKRILKATGKLPGLLHSPEKLVHRLRYAINRSNYYGNQNNHNERILVSDFSELDPGLKVFRSNSINDEQCKEWLVNYKADLVFVFGISLIKKSVLSALQYPLINMHWGWSPNYRGEGIVSALAEKGPQALGVTVHLLDEKIDGGEILYRTRPTIDKTDNFYSIGVKLGKLGSELFELVYHDYKKSKALRGSPQKLSEGTLYSSAFMALHPEYYTRAWKNLRSFPRDPA